MKVLLYAGTAPRRNLVLKFSVPIVQKIATSLTLLTGGGPESQGVLHDAVTQLQVPAHVPVELLALPGDARTAIAQAARSQPYDLVILGRLQQPLGRLLHGQWSKRIAQGIEPSVLRVDGTVRPIRRILLTSGGNWQTFDNARVTARLAASLGASVTLLHVLSQQSLLFEGFPDRCVPVGAFLSSTAPEAMVLRQAAALMHDLGVVAQTKARVGPVLDEVLTEARSGDYDLMVVGAHQVASALDRILLENITGDLLDLSPLPVLVAKS